MSVSGPAIGIVGLPNSGKSTLFNAILKRQIAQVAEYPYTTIEPNVGVVEVSDERLNKLAEVLKIPKKVPAAIKFIDIAGLIKGAHQGEGLGNQFLSHIREVDAILQVVRVFENPNVTRVHGEIDPVLDVEIVNLELELGGIKKPTIYVLNVSENQLIGESVNQKTRQINQLTHQPVISICAKLESELGQLSEGEQREYLQQLGLGESGLHQVILASYKLLNLITFFTVAGGKQAQAWPIEKGSTMIEAAQMVHTDFAKGFITAEIVDWQKLAQSGSWLQAKEKGLVRTVGKSDQIEDGYVVEFKFSV